MLRCFRTEECRKDGAALAATVSALLRSPALTLEDFSALYGSSASIRARY